MNLNLFLIISALPVYLCTCSCLPTLFLNHYKENTAALSVMASKVDMSLDELVTLGKKKGGGKPFQGKPKFTGGSGFQTQSGAQTKVGDLRKVIADKQKANISDLRVKLKPKALYTSKYASKQASKSNPTTPKASESRPLKARPKYPDTPTSKTRPRRSDPGPLSQNRQSSPKLPSYEEAKKITVTVPGTLRPTTSAEVRSLMYITRLPSVVW